VTEAEWVACSDPELMLEHLRGRRVYDRKLRLFACACCRLSWEWLKDERSRRAVEVAEQFADRRAKGHELASASRAAHAVVADFLRGLPASGTTDRGLDIEINVADAAWRTSARNSIQGDMVTIALRTRFTERHYGEDGGKGAMQVRFLRDIFGRPHPFPQVRVNREWLTADVVALASSIYEDRGYDRLPILADALEHAGCHDEQILGHCHGPGPHVRGCWVADLVWPGSSKRPNKPLQQAGAALRFFET
jgi:hypothetical protein